MNRIAVGMSGGVDSSVTALMLKNQGYDVIGITMLLKPSLTKEDEANLYSEANDASLVCKKIGIEHYIVDFREKFSRTITDYFVDEYFSGRTPNPCVRCNSTMKFGAMLDYALSLGCDKLATGHYAEIETVEDRIVLKKSDSPKDQSYFLYNLKQHQLKHIMFPMLSMDKNSARELAKKYDLPVADKPDSQDICFVKDKSYIDFINSYSKKTMPQGNFLDNNGNTIGKHGGIYKYTIGQRRGLGIALGYRCYVSAIDPLKNTVTISADTGNGNYELTVKNVNLIPFDTLKEPMDVMVKIRYRATPEPATITQLSNGDIKVAFKQSQKYFCPGQSAVFYDGDVVIGGGII